MKGLRTGAANMNFCLSAGAGFLFSLTGWLPAFAQPVSKVRIDSLVQQHMSDNHIPGLALAIIQNGRPESIRYYGYAQLESNTLVDSTTLFEIASMSKQMICAAILLLQEDGLLSVEDKLSQYLPDLPATWQEITVEQLMNHTSGLRDDWDEPTEYFLSNHTIEKMFAAQKEYPLLFQPGTDFQYSSGPFFLGLVIEKITGSPYGYFLQERLFDKLDMDHTYVFDPALADQHLATGYRWNQGTYLSGVDIPDAAESRADVGIVTNLMDMVKWDLAMNDNRLLDQESLGSMFSSGVLNDGSSIPYGYGWYIYLYRNQIIQEHAGAFRTGFNSRIVKFPHSGTDIIILCNKWQANLADLIFSIAALYDPEFTSISGSVYQKTISKSTDTKIKELFYALSTRTFDTGQLYHQVNASGFDPDELHDMLNGFHSISYTGTLRLDRTPVYIYNSAVQEIHYYKIVGEQTTYWSVACTDSGKIIFINLED